MLVINSFTILVDTNCDLPPEYIEEHEIEVLPMPFQLDGREYPQGKWQEISSKDYYQALREGGLASTSQINPDTFVKHFTEYAESGQSALVLTLSSGLSGTYQNAALAEREVREAYPESNIYTVDTLSATSGHGLLAMQAVKKRGEGYTAEETAAWLEEKKHSYFALFTVDDLMYLHRGGRLGKLSAVAGSVLGFKPILCIAPDGTLKLMEKVRGRKAAFEKLVGHMKRSTDPGTELETVLINHTDCEEDAEIFAEMVKSEVNVREVIVMMMGPVIGAHCGPGTVTVVYEANQTRGEYWQ